MLRKLVTWPESRVKLSQASALAVMEDCSEDVRDLIDTFNILQGYGLAAPQIGIQKRIIVINPLALGLDDLGEMLVMINPSCELSGKKFRNREACFSVPHVSAFVDRFSECVVTYTDLDMQERSLEVTGEIAACIQHEVDHLDGILYVDRISRLQRSMLLKKIRKIKKAEVQRKKLLQQEFNSDHEQFDNGLIGDEQQKKTTYSRKRKKTKRRRNKRSKSSRK